LNVCGIDWGSLQFAAAAAAALAVKSNWIM